MIKQERFFSISIEHLPSPPQQFNFALFIQHPQNNQYAVFLHENSFYDHNKASELKNFMAKGAILCIEVEKSRDFLNFCQLNQNDIPELSKRLNQWDHLHLKRCAQFDQIQQQHPSFLKIIKDSVKQQDFSLANQYIKAEILCWRYSISNTVSYAIHIAQSAFERDSLNARVMLLSYYFAKKLKIHDPQQLASLICACHFRNIGLTQMSFPPTVKKASMNQEQHQEWIKYPAYSVYLIKKANIQCSDLCLRLILEHNERYDGGGFPLGKKKEFTHPLSEVLGLWDHTLGYAMGHITGQTFPLVDILKSIINETKRPELHVNFGPHLKNELQILLD